MLTNPIIPDGRFWKRIFFCKRACLCWAITTLLMLITTHPPCIKQVPTPVTKPSAQWNTKGSKFKIKESEIKCFISYTFYWAASERKVRVTLLVSCWCCKLITILMPAHLDTWETTNTFLFSLGLESMQWVLTRAVTFDSSSTYFFAPTRCSAIFKPWMELHELDLCEGL